LGQAVLRAKVQINVTAYNFADIISLRRGIFFWDLSELQLRSTVHYFEMVDNFTHLRRYPCADYIKPCGICLWAKLKFIV